MFYIKKNRGKLGLALSGGVIKGLAHVGVLKVLEKNHIKVDYIAGTSSGSIVASLYAAGLPVEKIEKIVLDWNWNKILDFKISMKGMFTTQKLAKVLKAALPITTFKETKIPLRIITTDLLSAHQYVFKKPNENIITAICASSAIPGVFQPIKYHDMLLADGCFINNMPVSEVKKMGARKVIGINVIPPVMTRDPKNVIEIITRANDVIETAAMTKYHKDADLIITPIKEYLDPFSSSKTIYKKLIRWGEEATNTQINKIKKLL